MMGRYGHMGWLRRAKPRDREIVDAALARVGMRASSAIGRLASSPAGRKSASFLPAPSLSRVR